MVFLLKNWRNKLISLRVVPKFNEFLSCLAFAPDPAEVMDPIADAFYTSSTLTDALKKLNGILTSDESIFIKTFFEYL